MSINMVNMAKDVEPMPGMVKKSIEPDQDPINMTRRIFGVRTEKQALNRDQG